MMVEATSSQPFAFTAEHLKQVEEIISRYPRGKQASAVIPLLDLAQRQNQGWLSSAAIEAVAQTLSMPFMRVYEVASFYTMFNLQPVGKYFLQVCTTTPCMLRGSDELMAVCARHLGLQNGQTSKDKLFTVKEVECLGACANAPMVQINDDYYEDLDGPSFEVILRSIAKGEPVYPGSVIGRKSSEPKGKILRKSPLEGGDK